MSMFRTVMVYLGLGSDEEYDDGYLYDDEDGPERDHRGAVASPGRRPDPLRVETSSVASPTPVAVAPDTEDGTVSSVRPLRPVPDLEDEGGIGEVRSLDDDRPVEVIRPVAKSRAKPRSLSPQSFGDAKVVADEFRSSTPVVMNLLGLERDLERRLIDFSSGLCYGLGGSMDKLAPHVYLLIPKSVTVSDDDRRRIEERGYDR